MRISDVNAPWLEKCMRVDPGSVTNLRYERLGAGQVADTYRLSFDLVGQPAQTLVLKVTSLDEKSSSTGRDQQNYLREVRYYQKLGDSVDVTTPKCIHAEIDDDETEFALLLEDLSPCVVGDQLVGCTLAQAESVIDEAAKLHAPVWGSPELEQMSWLPTVRSVIPAELTYWPTVMDKVRKRYGALIEEKIYEVGDRFYANAGRFYELQRRARWTLQHGDFRPDNLLFDASGGKVSVAVVDWQTVQRGPGALDVSYFLGGALTPELRRAHERDLIARYHDGLVRLGVTDYSLEECFDDYVKFSFQGYFIGVGASMSVKQTERGDLVFASMIRRAGEQILDLGALDQLESVVV